jgi:hypothetical protein
MPASEVVSTSTPSESAESTTATTVHETSTVARKEEGPAAESDTEVEGTRQE